MPRWRTQTPEEREAERSWQQLRGWRIPLEVGIDGDRLVWRYTATRDAETALGRIPARAKAAQGSIRECKDASGNMLERFLAFADSRVSGRRIETFARRYGVFHHHGKPGAARGHDDVGRWRGEARLYASILAAAGDMRSGRVGVGLRHWQALAEALGREMPARSGFLGSLEFSILVQDAVQRFVVPHVPLATSVELDRGGWGVSLRFGGGSLRGALCAEILRELQGRERRQVACDGCGDLHVPRGQAGRRSFCRGCHASGAPVRFAKRDYRSRQARALAAFRRGASDEEAAEAAYRRQPTLGELARVQRWRRG